MQRLIGKTNNVCHIYLDRITIYLNIYRSPIFIWKILRRLLDLLVYDSFVVQLSYFSILGDFLIFSSLSFECRELLCICRTNQFPSCCFICLLSNHLLPKWEPWKNLKNSSISGALNFGNRLVKRIALTDSSPHCLMTHGAYLGVHCIQL